MEVRWGGLRVKSLTFERRGMGVTFFQFFAGDGTPPRPRFPSTTKCDLYMKKNEIRSRKQSLSARMNEFLEAIISYLLFHHPFLKSSTNTLFPPRCTRCLRPVDTTHTLSSRHLPTLHKTATVHPPAGIYKLHLIDVFLGM